MEIPYNVYEIFNIAEGFLWFGIAITLPFIVKASSPRQRRSVLCASFGFVLFGTTDILEAQTQGLAPTWLWIYKISCSTLILSCRFAYIGWKNFRLTDRYFIFGLLCLLTSIAIIILQSTVPAN